MKVVTNNIKFIYEIYKRSGDVTTDSRNVKPGTVFFALQGENFNGNEFASAAIDKGASLAVVDDNHFTGHKKMVVVENTLETLQNLARYHRKQLKTTVIGITGSNGKTTTKELIFRVLSSTHKTTCTKGNLNNHIGVPLTVLAIPPDTEFAVVEMGANHEFEIENLCTIAQPGYGLITNIGRAHLEGFNGFEGVIRAKTELYRYLAANSGKIFINIDDPLLMSKARELEKIKYGKKDHIFCSGNLLALHPYLEIGIEACHQQYQVKTQLVGAYNLENILAAACIGHYFNIEPRKIKEAIESYRPDNNRSQLIEKDTNIILLDAYNANPSSMKAALENFAAMPYNNKIVVLGEMLELGKESHDEHQNLVSLLEELDIESHFFIGKGFASIAGKSSRYFDSTDNFIEYLKTNPILNSTILIKGSRLNKLERIIEYL